MTGLGDYWIAFETDSETPQALRDLGHNLNGSLRIILSRSGQMSKTAQSSYHAQAQLLLKAAAMIMDIEEYFTKGCGRCNRFATPDCSTRIWRTGLDAMRRLCLDAGLQEKVKWGHPCYVHAGRNIAIIGALRGEFRLSFFDAALMTDSEGVLEHQGPNTRHADMIRFKANGDVTRLEPIIRTYLSEAMGYAAPGVRPPSDPQERDLPDELVAALDADPELAEAFHALTPGRRNSYVVNLNGAKTAATRTTRIAKFRDRIIAGKGATER